MRRQSDKDQESNLFEPLFKPVKKSDKKQVEENFTLTPLISLQHRPGTPIDLKIIGCYRVRDNQKEKQKVIEIFSKKKEIFLTFENENEHVEIILIIEDFNKYHIGSWFQEDNYIWDFTSEMGDANIWLLNHINYYDIIKIYEGKYNKNILI